MSISETTTNPEGVETPNAPKPGAPKTQWRDWTPAHKARVVTQGIVNLALMGWALWDLRHRTEDEIKGSKRTWTLLAFVLPVGPVAYFLFGRKREIEVPVTAQASQQ
jgi:hypothetical protein